MTAFLRCTQRMSVAVFPAIYQLWFCCSKFHFQIVLKVRIGRGTSRCSRSTLMHKPDGTIQKILTRSITPHGEANRLHLRPYLVHFLPLHLRLHLLLLLSCLLLSTRLSSIQLSSVRSFRNISLSLPVDPPVVTRSLRFTSTMAKALP